MDEIKWCRKIKSFRLLIVDLSSRSSSLSKFLDALNKVPWASTGRKGAISKLAQSIVPIGTRRHFPSTDLSEKIDTQDPAYEDLALDIYGTAFQAAPGRLLTAWHVVDDLIESEKQLYIQVSTVIDGGGAQRAYNIQAAMRYFDVRFENRPSKIDCGLLICTPADHPDSPYLVPSISWGKSEDLGVGDRVLIAGFPLGKAIFFANDTNRGLIQPSFFDGVISAIIPALREGETRLLQISSVSIRGMSGGVVCEPKNGRVVGMITSGVAENDVDLPITYAIPSEVLRPFVEAVEIETESGKSWA